MVKFKRGPNLPIGLTGVKRMLEKKNADGEYVYTFKVMGDEYIIRGKDDPQYMQEIATFIETEIQSVAKSNPKLNRTQVSVLTALRIADELHKLRKEYRYLEELLEQAK